MTDHIIPIPKKISKLEGTAVLNPCVSTEVPGWEKFARTAADGFSKIHFCDFSVGGEGGLVLEKDSALVPGSYTVSVDDRGAFVRAADDRGICFGIATALQLFEYDGKKALFTSEKCFIEDWADKEYRALMLDLVTAWHPLEKVLRMMDVCFFEKVPFIHLHLADNSAFRYPSKAFPDLATPKYSYSREDIAAMRSYAAARGLELIPELDIPGHARRLVTVYRDVFGNPLPADSQVEGSLNDTGGTICTDEVICAGSSTCFDGVKTLFNELCDLFPESKYIHIGGDEAYIQVWDACPVCRDYMAKNGLGDRGELYSDFVARVAGHILSLGRTPIVWEGFPRKGSERIPKETVVIAWESHYNLAPDLLEDGFRIINGSWQPLYIVFNVKRWTKEDIMNWNVCEWQHWWEHSAARLNPIHVPDSDRVWGGQISIWGCTYENEVNITIENLAAMSERCWNLVRTADEGQYHGRSDMMSRKLLRMIQDR